MATDRNGKEILLFSKRMMLAAIFEDWADQNHVLICPMSVIGWLVSEGLLDISKAKELIQEYEEKKKPDFANHDGGHDYD